MSNEFLDYIEDILDAMDKAKILYDIPEIEPHIQQILLDFNG